MTARTIEQLSEIIARNSAKLSLEFKNQGISSPTVNNTDNTPTFEAIDPRASRDLVDAARELEALVTGPSKMLTYMSFLYYDASSLGALLEFNIPALVPLEGTITLAELALQTGLSEDKLTRFVRFAITNFIFCEPSPGVIAHTSLSATLARDPTFCAALLCIAVDHAIFAVSLPATSKKWPKSEKMDECAVNQAYGTKDTFWEWMNKSPELQQRFHQAMAGGSGDGGSAVHRRLQSDVRAYPWVEKLGAKATVVDVGGGSGHFARALALAHPDFSITVQDRAEAFSDSAKRDDRPSNLNFQEHDFFTPQPLKGADVYFLRHIIHDWPHTEALKILRALLPALKPGARVLISERLLPSAEGGESLLEEKIVRQMDLHMMAAYNSKERSVEGYADLFQEANEKLKFQAKYQLPGEQKSCIFEAVWEGAS
ncbi:S-adenosyl-L-methionine-dependent methyltransferase [Jackrogersella minutella]|nr:S-adenosyl-L-methionine-dependent methyltransferase [Jackrogersella minutella]